MRSAAKKVCRLQLGAIAPDLFDPSHYVAWGSVLDHPNVADGHYAKTSWILRLDFRTGELETENTLYKLIN